MPHPRTQTATADLWRDRTGLLVARFSSLGYVSHGAIDLTSGGNVSESDLEELTYVMGDMLLEWIIDGVDDDPEPCGELGMIC